MLELLCREMEFKHVRRWLAVSFIASLLCGCSTDFNPPPAPSATSTGMVIGALGGGIIGSSTVVGGPLAAWFGGLAGATVGHNLDKQMTLLKEIENEGVQVILVGDYVKLVLPADKFFTQGAPTFNTYSFRLMDKIVTFLGQYPNISIKVSGYTDNRGTPERNLALSKEWAELVADYLWNHGLDTRVLYAEGYGDCRSVASNAVAYGRTANRRVEISLYRLTKQSL